MSTYKLRFWYWFQEVVISGITSDELIHSLFFSENFDMKDFYRETTIEGIGGLYPIVEHLKEDDPDSIDTRFGENNGRTDLDEQFWILEEEA